ncbi:lipid IV(A) 3-deoxy-D-manno-octulosonic acid transferase [Ferrigenium sp. UT5]|uniref:lipid IV(A) 3-deoxy-D-manno-octulosonic acid transferase n=1 Tax=Ferrigenium sp. UT5 TaxID=3242105 RepID=UPI00354B6030
MNPRFFYTALLWVLLPYVFLHLLWRARRQRQYLNHTGERFGRYAVTPDKPVIWLHVVSVGETRATVTLVQQLRARHPGHQILLTHITPTGRNTSEQLYGDDVLRVYLPYDYPFAVRRFLEYFKPKIGVLLETEIWFNLIDACHTGNIPLLLLNARLSPRSARRYARFRSLAREGLHGLALIAAQTEEDALRLASLGNRAVPVMGNLKFDILPPPDLLARGAELRQRFGALRPVLLAASTREGEEELLLNALEYAAVDYLLVVIVPRHPQRFDEVARLIEQKGYRMQRRSTNAPIAADTQVVLGDSMGELFAYYAACDAAFIGGSLLPLGGQNLIEACAVGKPVLIGPHTFNFTQAAEAAIAHGAALRVQHADDLVHLLNVLMYDPARLKAMGEAGRRFVEANQGATERAVSLIDNLLDRNP